ncbi:MAG: sulfatase-like hydrolase/transferase [Elusimicrobia bacterium]|nr:sulfatase-like hydrolase/transferase [Elusimicrobiota bacterium]
MFDGPLTAAAPPHIFIIVIDSLRPDYLGAYSPAVRFTPNIDRFAREADVFRGFTAYGGTALSEPSIWAGARLPHEQYPSPFHPLNALEKLVDALSYRPLITMDVILTRLLGPGKAATALDKETLGTYKLCATLAELEGRLDAETASRRPLFVYTQPQDIHVSVINNERVPAVDPRWSGFYGPYAARVAAMDACFGNFLKALKARGLYDQSVVVLTADHGDSLGEGGRWGHAYTLFPEIARVPLIMRLPPARRAKLEADLDAPAFGTDVTPSLYAALGLKNDPKGRRDLIDPEKDALGRAAVSAQAEALRRFYSY